jgi:hypothetical protein
MNKRLNTFIAYSLGLSTSHNQQNKIKLRSYSRDVFNQNLTVRIKRVSFASEDTVTLC